MQKGGKRQRRFIDLNTRVQPQKVNVGITMDLEDQQQWASPLGRWCGRDLEGVEKELRGGCGGALAQSSPASICLDNEGPMETEA